MNEGAAQAWNRGPVETCVQASLHRGCGLQRIDLASTQLDTASCRDLSPWSSRQQQPPKCPMRLSAGQATCSCHRQALPCNNLKLLVGPSVRHGLHHPVYETPRLKGVRQVHFSFKRLTFCRCTAGWHPSRLHWARLPAHSSGSQGWCSQHPWACFQPTGGLPGRPHPGHPCA